MKLEATYREIEGDEVESTYSDKEVFRLLEKIYKENGNLLSKTRYQFEYILSEFIDEPRMSIMEKIKLRKAGFISHNDKVQEKYNNAVADAMKEAGYYKQDGLEYAGDYVIKREKVNDDFDSVNAYSYNLYKVTITNNRKKKISSFINEDISDL